MTPEKSPQLSQAEMAAQAAAVMNGAFAEQMAEDYTVLPANPDAAGMDKFGEWYALGAFAETADAARKIYEEHAETWQNTVNALVQTQLDLTIYHEVHAKEEKVTSLSSKRKRKAADKAKPGTSSYLKQAA